MDTKTKAGSLIAAVGVMASLGLVAYELRQNTQAVVGQTLQALAEQHTELALAGVENADLRTAWAVGADDPSALTEAQREHLSWFYAAVVRVTENRFRQYQLGTLDEDALLQLGANGPVFRNAYFKTWWPDRRSFHTQDFVDFVDTKLVPLERVRPGQ